jgi:hypothetical protein
LDFCRCWCSRSKSMQQTRVGVEGHQQQWKRPSKLMICCWCSLELTTEQTTS